MNTVSKREFLTMLAVSMPAVALAQTSDQEFDMVEFEPPFPAPDIDIIGIEGKQHIVGEGQDHKFILLNFWATWCPPCINEMPSLQALQDQMDPVNFQVLAISSDAWKDRDRVKKFVEDLGLRFSVAHDSDSVISRAYGAREFPSTYLINPVGEVVAAAKGERVWHTESALSFFTKIMEQNA